ncbi:hypothetical protein TSOC_008740 [Tetrabaena socialis]|uniref:Uncharacterized protein n=1 Tax=Tetrabaena socialis TaxID=47790 RepID=A0A2J7ZXL3_9CHLO|nr:hypothetical protein TSOC_008740 [Tetrabaena socialis]|eukprot:PNH05013.1 hypothetical protein TSOC_008740 [Tetrabaena socialis]
MAGFTRGGSARLVNDSSFGYELDRSRKQAADAEAAVRGTESQARELVRADSRAERDRRAAEAEVRARDVRLQRALEEVERYKQLLSDVRAQRQKVHLEAARALQFSEEEFIKTLEMGAA